MAENPYTPLNSESIESNLPAKPFRLWRILLLLAIGFVLIGLIVPATRRGSGREAVRRMQCGNNLKQIALALLNYANANQELPPAYTVDAAGKPLHSWRTLILPYLEQKGLYDQVDLSKPWDDPANEAVRNAKLSVFQCVSVRLELGFTTYMVVLSQDSCIRPVQSQKLADVHSPGETLLVMEADGANAVHWMSPVDLDLRVFLDANLKSKAPHTRGRHACFVDGRIEFLQNENLAVDLPLMVSGKQ